MFEAIVIKVMMDNPTLTRDEACQQARAILANIRRKGSVEKKRELATAA